MSQLDEVVVFLAAPLAMCLVLAGIHCYLGLHVLARGVVFVDLSLAQVAMLGAAVAALYGFDHHSTTAYFMSLGFTLFSAGVFATVRRYKGEISQEALIGIVYAFSSAAIILVLDRTPHGMEELKESLIGQMLLVEWADVSKTLAIYSVVGALHFFFRKPLWAASRSHQNASWKADFLFYGLFGVVITSSTHYAGVLLVFSLLIVPSLLAMSFYRTVRAQLLFGWAFGAVFCVAGVTLSYIWDFPVGAFIVVLFTIVPIVVYLGGSLRRMIRS